MGMFLKCDAPTCDHQEMVADYGPHLIDKPCPICGANLLTKQDFEEAEPLRLLVKGLEALGLTSARGTDQDAMVKVGQHAGKTTIEVVGPMAADPAKGDR